jgi:hypothetical protein
MSKKYKGGFFKLFSGKLTKNKAIHNELSRLTDNDIQQIDNIDQVKEIINKLVVPTKAPLMIQKISDDYEKISKQENTSQSVPPSNSLPSNSLPSNPVSTNSGLMNRLQPGATRVGGTRKRKLKFRKSKRYYYK